MTGTAGSGDAGAPRCRTPSLRSAERRADRGGRRLGDARSPSRRRGGSSFRARPRRDRRLHGRDRRRAGRDAERRPDRAARCGTGSRRRGGFVDDDRLREGAVTLTLFESIQRIVQDELQSVRTAELAVVQEQHPLATRTTTRARSSCATRRSSSATCRSRPRESAPSRSPPSASSCSSQFVGGDINAPVIVGRLYNDEDRPPENEDGEAVLHLPLGAADDERRARRAQERRARASCRSSSAAGSTLTLRDDDPVGRDRRGRQGQGDDRARRHGRGEEQRQARAEGERDHDRGAGAS